MMYEIYVHTFVSEWKIIIIGTMILLSLIIFNLCKPNIFGCALNVSLKDSLQTCPSSEKVTFILKSHKTLLCYAMLCCFLTYK